MGIFASTALERFAVNFAQEIHRDLVAVLGFATFLAIVEVLRGFRKVGQSFVYRASSALATKRSSSILLRSTSGISGSAS